LRANQHAVNAKSSKIIEKLLANWPEAGIQHVATETSAVELRHRMAQLLGQLKSEKAIEFIARDLLASPRQEDQVAGLLALRQQRSGWTESQRRLQFEILRDADRMVGGEGLPKFMSSIREDSLNTLSGSERQSLASILEAKGEGAIETGPPRAHVQKWSIDDLPALVSSSLVEGDRELGAKIFRDALCARCHRVGREGKAVGPDLTFVGRRFSPRDLLEAILTPSRSVAENFQLDAIVTQSGEIHTGRILIEGDYRSQKIRIQTDPLKSDSVVEINKSDIEEHKQLARSPMPDGLLDVFSRDEIRALIAYLQNPNT
jgi:putative heme-binding domain-containing protein